MIETIVLVVRITVQLRNLCFRQEVSLEDLQDPEILIFGVTHDLNFDPWLDFWCHLLLANYSVMSLVNVECTLSKVNMSAKRIDPLF